MSDINLVIRYDNGNLDVVAKETEEKLGKAGDKAGKKAGANFAKAFQGAGGQITSVLGAVARGAVKGFALAGATAGVALTKSLADSANVESVETQFRTLLRSGERAQELVSDLQEFGATTPFELKGLSTATTQLLSFGTAQEDIIPTLQKLGDVAAGVNAPIEDLTIPFGRLVSTQKLTLVELDKFADRGAITYQQLADKAGISIRNIRDAISKGQVPFEVFTQVLDESTQEGGKFFNSMQNQSRTLSGALSNLSDAFFGLSSTIGKAFRPLVTRGVVALANALESIRQRAEGLNIFDDLLIPLTRFNDNVITYVIRPFELVFNVAERVGNFVGTKFSEVANSLLDFFQPVIDLANKALKFLKRELIDVGQTIKQTFEESNEDGFFKGVIDDTSLTDSLRSQNAELRATLIEQRDIIEAEQNALITTGAENTTTQVQMLADQYTSIFSILGGVADSALTGVGNNFKNINDRIQESNKVVADFTKKTGTAFQKGFAGAIGGAFADFGRALQSGDNALQAFGQSFLKAIGNTLVQQGTAFILEGTAYTFSANPALQAKGPGLIGAGSAMAVFGGLLGASVSGGGAGGSGGGGTTGGSTEFQDPVTGEFVGQLEGGAEPNTVLNINVEGNVVDQDAFTRRLVEQIGEEGGRQGLVFDNFSTV